MRLSTAMHEANSAADPDNLWFVAGTLLAQADYDVDAWRQLDTFEIGFLGLANVLSG